MSKTVSDVSIVEILQSGQVTTHNSAQVHFPLAGLNLAKLVNRVYEEEVAGKQPRGHPKKRWHENFKYTWLYNGTKLLRLVCIMCTGYLLERRQSLDGIVMSLFTFQTGTVQQPSLLDGYTKHLDSIKESIVTGADKGNYEQY